MKLTNKKCKYILIMYTIYKKKDCSYCSHETFKNLKKNFSTSLKDTLLYQFASVCTYMHIYKHIFICTRTHTHAHTQVSLKTAQKILRLRLLFNFSCVLVFFLLDLTYIEIFQMFYMSENFRL